MQGALVRCAHAHDASTRVGGAAPDGGTICGCTAWRRSGRNLFVTCAAVLGPRRGAASPVVRMDAAEL